MTAVAAGMTAARAAGVELPAGGAHSACATAVSLLPVALVGAGQLRPQARVLGARRGDLGAQPRDLVLARVAAHARLPHGVRPAAGRGPTSHRNHLVGEGILPEHLADLLLDLVAIEPDVLLRLRERPIDRRAAARLAVPLPHRLIHQVGVGPLLRRHLGGGRRQLAEQRAPLRLLGHLAGARWRTGANRPTTPPRNEKIVARISTPETSTRSKRTPL